MPDAEFTVYGMKLQPGDHKDTFSFCKEESIIGIGWPLEDKQYSSVEEIKSSHEKIAERRKEEGKKVERINADGRLYAPLRHMIININRGDYVWVNEGNQFALCKIQSDWDVTSNLDRDDGKRYSNNGIHHFRYVDWVDIPYSYVPGFIRRKFARRYGTLKEMDDGINEKSKIVIQALHSYDDIQSENSLNRKAIAKKISNADTKFIFTLLDQNETEDIVISHLQSEGWRVIKSSTSSSQAKIECEMRREVDERPVLGYLQVKTGSATANPKNYQEYADSGEMIFFVESGIDVDNYERMSTIEPETIKNYMVENYNYLPSETLLKLDFMLN